MALLTVKVFECLREAQYETYISYSFGAETTPLCDETMSFLQASICEKWIKYINLAYFFLFDSTPEIHFF